MIKEIMDWVEPIVLTTFVITLLIDAYELRKIKYQDIVPAKRLKSEKGRVIYLQCFIILELIVNIFQ
jgi:hypothetical protein